MVNGLFLHQSSSDVTSLLVDASRDFLGVFLKEINLDTLNFLIQFTFDFWNENKFSF